MKRILFLFVCITVIPILAFGQDSTNQINVNHEDTSWTVLGNVTCTTSDIIPSNNNYITARVMAVKTIDLTLEVKSIGGHLIYRIGIPDCKDGNDFIRYFAIKKTQNSIHNENQLGNSYFTCTLGEIEYTYYPSSQKHDYSKPYLRNGTGPTLTYYLDVFD